jgi:hypothetical protein
MNIQLITNRFLITVAISLLTACSVAKLEARLEANPQCKDVVNPKTGALMPCPGSDKAFYKEVGLAPVKPAVSETIQTDTTAAPISEATAQPSSNLSSTAITPAPKTTPAAVECKPQIHKKTGGILPCPAQD